MALVPHYSHKQPHQTPTHTKHPHTHTHTRTPPHASITCGCIGVVVDGVAAVVRAAVVRAVARAAFSLSPTEKETNPHPHHTSHGVVMLGDAIVLDAVLFAILRDAILRDPCNAINATTARRHVLESGDGCHAGHRHDGACHRSVND